MKIKENWLHVYGQYDNHCPVTIRGNVQALTALRDAIGIAIASGTSDAEVFTTDGEGYHVQIERCSVMRLMGRVPYLMWEAIRENEERYSRQMREHIRNRQAKTSPPTP